MESKKDIVVSKDIGILQNPASHSDANALEPHDTQNENNYDSHSEQKPHQKTSVSKDAKPDRVSHDTRDTTSKKTLKSIDVATEEGNDEGDAADSKEEFPKSNCSTFPSIS